MTTPPANITVEPLVNGKLVYLPMAPSMPGQKPLGRLMVELNIQNTSSTKLVPNQLTMAFPGLPSATVPMGQVINPGTTFNWSMPAGSNDYLLDLSAPPKGTTLIVSFAGYSDPIAITLLLAPHTGPAGVGAYRFPSLASDLKLGEFWQVNGSNHGPGNHQAFGYDMGVWGIDHQPGGTYSPFIEGAATKNQPNTDYRVYGKPVRAMAAGEVIEIVNTCPDNPAPLYPDKPEDMQKLLDAQQLTWQSFKNGVAGNHVVIQHGDEVAVYAHMQMNSIDASLKARKPRPSGMPPIPGTMVTAGQFIGKAGNSGNATNPHLHIHSEQPLAYVGGPRPMLFTGAWAIDNDLLGGPGDNPGAVQEPAAPWVQLNSAGIPPGDPDQAYTGDSFVVPSGSPRWPEVVHYNVEENDYQALWDKMNAKGLSVAWINTHTIEKGPLFFWTFFNVVFRPKLGRDEPPFHGLDAAQFDALQAKRENEGYQIKQLESYFSMRAGKQLFAGIFARYGGLPPRLRLYRGKTFDEHWKLANRNTEDGYVPKSVSVVSVKGTLSYTAVWQGGSAAYDMEEHLTPATIQGVFDRNHKEQRFTTYLKGYFHQGKTFYSGIWASGAGDGKVRHDLPLSGFGTVLTGQRQANHLLRSVSGYQLDGDAAFGGIWEA